MTGIYKITNKENGECYIGSSVNIEKRWKQHLSRYNNESGRYYMRPLYVAFREFGIDKFQFEILELCSEDDLIVLEQKNYEIYKPKYNKKEPRNCISMKEVKCSIRKSMRNAFANYEQEKKELIYENLKKGQHTEGFEKQKYQSKKIKAICSEDGKELYFDSLYQAEKELNISRSSICQILNPNHARKQAKGYTFEYILQCDTVPSQEKRS